MSVLDLSFAKSSRAYPAMSNNIPAHQRPQAPHSSERIHKLGDLSVVPIKFGDTSTFQTFPKRPLLFSIDFDDTLVPWARWGSKANRKVLMSNIKALNQFSPNSLVMVNTGRSLEGIKGDAHLLNGLVVDFLATDNGYHLFANTHRLPADLWVQQLESFRHDPWWAEEVIKKSPFQGERAAKLGQHILAEQGFKPIPFNFISRSVFPHGSQLMAKPTLFPKNTKKGYVLNPIINGLFNLGRHIGAIFVPATLAGFYPDKSSYIFTSPLKQISKQARADALAFHKDYLTRSGTLGPLEATFFEAKDQHGWMRHILRNSGLVYVFFDPKGIDKSAIIDHVARRIPDLKAVITAGDAGNDKEQLGKLHYGDNLPNYPLAINARGVLPDTLVQALKAHPRKQKTAPNSLGEGLQQLSSTLKSLIT